MDIEKIVIVNAVCMLLFSTCYAKTTGRPPAIRCHGSRKIAIFATFPPGSTSPEN
jgi:hypothetical protein